MTGFLPGSTEWFYSPSPRGVDKEHMLNSHASIDDPVLAPADWQARAQKLQQLHQGPEVLVLLNPWDRLSARLFAGLPGCQALATTSSGIAAALGYPDGETAPLDRLLAVVREIVEAVDVPVTVDFEAGYGETAEQVAENVRRAVAAGAVGINLEDGIGDGGAKGVLRDPEEQVERVAAAREALQIDGVHGVLNARTDVYLQRHGLEDAWLPEAVRRCQLYAEHGADCVYVPGVPRRDQTAEEGRRDIEIIVREVGRPLNVLAASNQLSVAELNEIGVRRLSIGSSIARLAYAEARNSASHILTTGDLGVLAPGDDLPHGEINTILAR